MLEESDIREQVHQCNHTPLDHVLPPRFEHAYSMRWQRSPVRVTTALLFFCALSAAFHQSGKRALSLATPEYTFKVVHVFPHDSKAFTQGLAWREGFLYEGTGLNGRSSLRKVSLETGKVIQQVDLPPEFFGEGITLFNNEIIQLTWQSQTGFVYNASNFRLLRRFSYPGEGWGLATKGHEIFMSDGTDEIRILDANTLSEKRRIKVHDGAAPVAQLNELEFVAGEIFANVWQSDRIARISPQNGMVLGWIDLTGLLSPMYQRGSDAVLNGIAYDPARRRLFVTGKLWPSVFEIQIVRKTN
jgi:glutaminyl-peptide cyclotransferase